MYSLGWGKYLLDSTDCGDKGSQFNCYCRSISIGLMYPVPSEAPRKEDPFCSGTGAGLQVGSWNESSPMCMHVTWALAALSWCAKLMEKQIPKVFHVGRDVKRSYIPIFCLKQDQPWIVITIITFMPPSIPLNKSSHVWAYADCLMLCLVSKHWRIHNLNTPLLTLSMGT